MPSVEQNTAARPKGKRPKKVKRQEAPFTRLSDDARVVGHKSGRAELVLVHGKGGPRTKVSLGTPYFGKDGQVSQIALQRGQARARELRVMAGASTRSKVITMAELADLVVRWAQVTYPKQISVYRGTQKFLVATHGGVPIDEFGPKRLLEFRTAALEDGRWNRVTLLARVACVVRMIAWAVGREMLDGSRLVALEAVEPLPHDQGLPSRDVLPVDEDTFRKTLPFMPLGPRAIVETMWASGARCGEVCALRPVDIDTSQDPWVAVLSNHKSKHKGKTRTLYFGAEAQRVLQAFMDGRLPNTYLFRPAESEEARLEARTGARTTKAGHGHVADEEARARLLGTLRPCYDTNAVRIAIGRACEKAGISPAWNPHQVRHAYGQRARDAGFDLESVAAVLGHSDVQMAKVYAQLDKRKAIDVTRKLG